MINLSKCTMQYACLSFSLSVSSVRQLILFLPHHEGLLTDPKQLDEPPGFSAISVHVSGVLLLFLPCLFVHTNRLVVARAEKYHKWKQQSLSGLNDCCLLISTFKIEKGKNVLSIE